MTEQSGPDLSAGIPARAAAIRSATDRLLSAVAAAAPDPHAPSLLPDWSVGHVLTHIARNADAQRNLLHWAESGEVTVMYPGGTRNQDIEAGAGRPWSELVADLEQTAARLDSDVAALPAGAWSALIRTSAGGEVTADVVLSQRLAEVELHHHDLGIDGGLALLDDPAAAALLAAVRQTYLRTRDVTGIVLLPEGGTPVVLGVPDRATRVAGPAAAIVGWLAGRSDGADLQCDGPLPDLPKW